MSALSLSLKQQLRGVFAELPSTVTLAVFTDSRANAVTREICDDTRQLAEELAELSAGKLAVEMHDLADTDGYATVYGVDKVPAIAVLGGPSGRRDFGIRFYGIPSGYEFGTLVEDIRMVSRGSSDLSASTREAVSQLRQPIHIQVYVTPTCPYCPRAVLLAHKLALENDLITADMVDASEFPELADRYRVYGVPRTVINETVQIEGAVPETALMRELAPLLTA